MKKRTFAFLLTGILALSSITACGKKSEVVEEAPETVSVTSEDLTYEVSTNPLKYEDKKGEELLSFSYDTIQVTTEGYDALNHSLGRLSELSKQCIYTEFNTDKDMLDSEGYTEAGIENGPWSYSDKINVVEANSQYLSLWVESNSYLGGAHPNYGKSGHVYLSNSGVELTLSAICTNYDEVKAYVLKALENYEYADGYFEDWKETAEAMLDGDRALSYVLTKDGADLYFDPYVLGPYALGAVEIQVPMEQLELDFTAAEAENEAFIPGNFLEEREGKGIFDSYDDVIQHLEPGEGYAYITLKGYEGDLLAISNTVYQNEDGKSVATELAVYANIGASVSCIGNAIGYSQDYPLTCGDGMLYAVSDQEYESMEVCSESLGLMLMETISESTDENNQTTYYGFLREMNILDDEGVDVDITDRAEFEVFLRRALAEPVITFTVV